MCGAIFSAAGSSKLARECAKYGHCKTGGAVITSACDMKNAKYIVHAVGPIYSGGMNGEPEQLYSCYKESLKLAMDNHCRSIGFPLISSGIFGYPHDEAWKIALSACKDFINENPGYDISIVFVSTNRDRDAYLQKMYMFSKNFYESQNGSALESAINQILNN